LAEQATAQDEEYRLRDGVNEQNTDNQDNDLAAQASSETQANRFFQGG